MRDKRQHRTARARSRRRPPLGQHFLSEPRVLDQILRWLDCRAEDCWFEIGAGHGEMTLRLAATGGYVVAVERDPKLAASLRERLSGQSRAAVIESDILELPLARLASEHGCPESSGRLRVYGSLPYYITSPILRHLFNSLDIIADIHVIVQREVAERLVARPGSRDYGYLSVLTQFHAQAEILQPIPRGTFRPPPRVESALVRLAPPGQRARLAISEPEKFLRFVGACFQQKRKTLFNNLRRFHQAARVTDTLAAAGLGSRARAEELSLDQFARLYHLLSPPGRSVVAP